MRAEARAGLKNLEQAEDVFRGVVEEGGWPAVERNVEMDSPLGIILELQLRIALQSDIEVPIALDHSVGPALDDLMKVDAVGKVGEGVPCLRRRPDFQRGAEMDLADFDVVPLEHAQGVLWFFEFHGQVAGVVINSEVFLQTGVIWPSRTHPLEERRRF